MSGRVRFDLQALSAGARNADQLAVTFGELTGSVRTISLHGLEPSTRARTQGAVQRAAQLSQRACHRSERQARAIRQRSALARRADAALGGFLRFSGPILKHAATDVPSQYDITGYLNDLRKTSREILKTITVEDRQARKKLKYALSQYEAYRTRQRKWPDAEAMRREMRRPNSPYNRQIRRLRDLERRTRFLDAPERFAGKLPKGLTKNPIVKRVPLLGPALGYAGAKAEGRSNADAAGKTAAQTAGAAAGGAAGGAVCGAVAAGTFGIGAATCPVMILGGSVIGDRIAGAAYDPVKKLGGKAIKGVKGAVKGIPNPVKAIKGLL